LQQQSAAWQQWQDKKGITKRHKKGSRFVKEMTIVGGFPVSRTDFYWGSFFKMDFRRRPFNQKPLVFRKNPRTHLESMDHLVMKDFPKMLKIMNFKETHYLARQKIGDAGSISTQNIFPLSSVVSKTPESPYGANKKMADN